MGHYIQNRSDDTPVRYLEVFKSPNFQDVSLNQWMALTPPQLIKEHLNFDKAMKSLRKEKCRSKLGRVVIDDRELARKRSQQTVNMPEEQVDEFAIYGTPEDVLRQKRII